MEVVVAWRFVGDEVNKSQRAEQVVDLVEYLSGEATNKGHFFGVDEHVLRSDELSVGFFELGQIRSALACQVEVV